MDVDNAALEGCFRAVDPEADMFADSSQGPGNNIMETDDGRYMEQGSASGTVGKLIQEENTGVSLPQKADKRGADKIEASLAWQFSLAWQKPSICSLSDNCKGCWLDIDL